MKMMGALMNGRWDLNPVSLSLYSLRLSKDALESQEVNFSSLLLALCRLFSPHLSQVHWWIDSNHLLSKSYAEIEKGKPVTCERWNSTHLYNCFTGEAGSQRLLLAYLTSWDDDDDDHFKSLTPCARVYPCCFNCPSFCTLGSCILTLIFIQSFNCN